ncbi:M23 family metallopeptidase [Vibrio sp. S9_S30]|uniref:M23 family metallopeptidase n=1 Tax=Vibrio sp. S9_S30 TaxID=2720226 RepID=UPI001681787B|nr:M23 family metallopeptidase [Vibrio sp. S9_S30]MBD1556748.1 M23 family metallopeptidase [Vibrio sp. S9_S30]
MTRITLTGSVGLKGKNAYSDIKRIQISLNKLASLINLKEPLAEDSSLGSNPAKSKTVGAIKSFQALMVGMAKPDGRIDVNGRSHKTLSKVLDKTKINQSKLPSIKIAPFSIIWPLKKNKIRRGSKRHTFGYVRRNRDGSKRGHQGWDFEARVGTPVYSIATGKVEYFRNFGDYGKQLCVSFLFNDKIHYAFYAHLKSVTVSKGDLVHAGEHIGYTGDSGNAKNDDVREEHLHFEIRLAPYVDRGLAGRIDPFNVFKKCPLSAPQIQSSALPQCFVDTSVSFSKILDNR